MSDKRSEAQQNRRARERAESHAGVQAAKAAEAAAARAPDGPMEFQADPNATADAFSRGRGEDEPKREVKRGNPSRTMAYEQMMSERKERAENTVHEQPRPEPEKPAAPEPEPVATATATEPTETAPAPEPAAEAPAAPEMVEVKIDGEVRQVPKQEVEDHGGVRAYQIIKAQEKRLQEVNRYASQMGQMFQQLQQSMQPPPQPQKKAEEVIRDAIAKIQLGTPEEAAAAFQEAIGTLVPKPVDTQTAAMQAYLLNQVTQAENQFIRDNPDLVGNPMLKQLVISEKNRRLGEMQQQKRLPEDWNAFYTSIATDLRQALGRPPIATPVSQPASQPTSGLAEKSARKADIVALPTAATRAAAPEAEKPLTRDEILARARKARGQPI